MKEEEFLQMVAKGKDPLANPNFVKGSDQDKFPLCPKTQQAIKLILEVLKNPPGEDIPGWHWEAVNLKARSVIGEYVYDVSYIDSVLDYMIGEFIKNVDGHPEYIRLI